MTNFSLPNARASPVSHTAHDEAAALIHSLHDQLELYEKLHDLAQRQGSLIGDNDGAALLDLLARRQRVIDELTDLHRTFQPLRQRWPAIARVLDADQRHQVALTCDRIQWLRQRIVEQDELDRAALRDAQARLGIDLRRLAQSGTALKAYGSSAGRAAGADDSLDGIGPVGGPAVKSRFTDRQG